MTSSVEIQTCFLFGHVTLFSSARASLKKLKILSKPFASYELEPATPEFLSPKDTIQIITKPALSRTSLRYHYPHYLSPATKRILRVASVYYHARILKVNVKPKKHKVMKPTRKVYVFILNVECTPGQGGYLWSCLIIIFFILLISIQPGYDVLDQTILRRKAEIS